MKKYKLFIWALILIGASSAVLAQGTYVRKHLEPDFFIPEDAKSKPEKLPPVRVSPRYYGGENLTTEIIYQEITPDYQLKYDEYSKDVEQLKNSGTIPENKKLEEDLQKMSSGERFKVEKKPYQKSSVQEEFDKVLEQSLLNN